MSESYTGGCQCGAVRFRIKGTLGEASICHCRMCQKAFGNFFAPLVDARHEDLAWTRGKPSYYASSDVRLYLFDTTLRDGAQTRASISPSEKIGFRGCWTSSGSTMSRAAIPAPTRPTRSSFSKGARRSSKRATFTAFGMTKRAGAPPRTIRGAAGVLIAGTDAVCLVAKAWDFHVREALGITQRRKPRLHRRLREGRASVRRRARGDDRLRAFLRRLQGQSGLCAHLPKAAYRGGRALGRAVRHQWRHAAHEIGASSPRSSPEVVPGTHLGIHAHNDTETAVANSLAAVAPACGRSRAR
jgi:hypothetical protein